MIHRDQLDMKGRLTLKIRNSSDGALVREIVADNLIVNTGRALVANLFAGQGGPEAVSQIAVGTNGADTDVSQDQLLQEVLRKPISNLIVEATNDNHVRVQVSIDLDDNEPPIPQGETAVGLQEAGIFNEDGIMYNRVKFPVVNKTADFKLTLFWEIIF